MKPNSCRRRFIVLAPLFIIAFLGLFTSLVYSLWNGVLVDVLSVKAITFWQALGILVLAKILFGGFPPGRGRFGPRGRRRFVEHWESLTPEQREQMRDEMRRRFGECPQPGECGWSGANPPESPKV